MSIKTSTVELAGTPYELRFDIVALTAAHTVIKSLGYHRENVWSLADVPYDLGEEIALFIQGVNGAKRLSKDTKLMDSEQAQEIFEAHFEWLADKTSVVEDEKEAMKLFQDEHTKVMEQISQAVRESMGFQRKRAKGGSPSKPAK